MSNKWHRPAYLALLATWTFAGRHWRRELTIWTTLSMTCSNHMTSTGTNESTKCKPSVQYTSVVSMHCSIVNSLEVKCASQFTVAGLEVNERCLQQVTQSPLSQKVWNMTQPVQDSWRLSQRHSPLTNNNQMCTSSLNVWCNHVEITRVEHKRRGYVLRDLRLLVLNSVLRN